ncbi:transcription initiation factor TFIID subunit 11-like [Quillaja saponaria]|uniref:Transcription initiation factor TFIID subunit 11-like n=1 Tax=Quillaja saponaria TaxID=32244 RepID=A0AAD7VHX2_QUISA|nr:transcription initiation factor TFIID subunit 11-like [Quillaja saponaria]
MAETENQEEPTVLPKRKPDLDCEDNENHPKKIQKLEALVNNSPASEGKVGECEAIANKNHHSEEKIEKVESDVVAEAYNDEDDEGEYEDEEDDGDDEDGEESNGKIEVDRKGKGITRDDKGKGKMIMEDQDDESDDSDSNDDGAISDSDSDLSDDPLAEVDLDNILPSRTRRRTVHPGVYIANDLGNDNDDSDDSDA